MIRAVRRRRGAPALLILALALLLTLGTGSRPATASGGPGGPVFGVADGVSGSWAFYLGSTQAPADSLGDQVEFSVAAASGSAATPQLKGGGTTQRIPLSGAACDGNRAVGFPQKCAAIAFVTSATTGAVTWTAKNVNTGGPTITGTITFLPFRGVVAGQRKMVDQSSDVVVQNVGTATANVSVAWLADSGEPWGSADLKAIPPGGTRIFDFSTFGGDTHKYSVHLGSDQPIAALSEFIRRLPDGRVAIGGSRAYPATPGVTSNTLTLPYVANALEGAYNTSFSVVNTGRTTACFMVTYTFVPGAGSVPSGGRLPFVDSGPGGGGCAAGYPLAAGGQRTFSPDGKAQTTAMPGQTRNALMAAKIEVTNGSAAATVEAYTSDGTAKAAAYEGFFVRGAGADVPATDLGTSLSIPLALKTADGYYTQILLSNPNDAPAKVSIRYSGNTGQHTVAMTIPAQGVANHSVYSDSTVPLGFVGSAAVTSDIPVAAVVFRSKKISPDSELDEDIYTAVNGVPASRASTTAYLPWVSRRAARDASHEGANTWVSVSVAGGGAANVTLRSIGGCGSVTTNIFTETRRITGSFIFYQNLDQENGLGDTPTCFQGGMTVTSDAPVLTVVGWVCDCQGLRGETEEGYNGITP